MGEIQGYRVEYAVEPQEETSEEDGRDGQPEEEHVLPVQVNFRVDREPPNNANLHPINGFARVAAEKPERPNFHAVNGFARQTQGHYSRYGRPFLENMDRYHQIKSRQQI